jgi:SNF family Na+-dependent transporter
MLGLMAVAPTERVEAILSAATSSDARAAGWTGRLELLGGIVMSSVYVVVIGFVIGYFLFAGHVCVREC